MTRRSLLAASVAAAAMVVVACGSTPSSAGSAATTPKPTPKPTPAPILKVATAAVAGKPETVITNAAGFTLYYYLPDKGAGKVTCVAACLQAWPPLLLPNGVTAPTGAAGVTGTLGTVANPNGGQQVTYNGWPVYLWTKDTAPGMTTGQNVGRKWFVVTPAVPPPG